MNNRDADDFCPGARLIIKRGWFRWLQNLLINDMIKFEYLLLAGQDVLGSQVANILGYLWPSSRDGEMATASYDRPGRRAHSRSTGNSTGNVVLSRSTGDVKMLRKTLSPRFYNYRETRNTLQMYVFLARSTGDVHLYEDVMSYDVML